MKNRWIAGLLAVCMMLTVTMGSLPAMAAQDEITEDLRGENTTSEPLTTTLQEAVQAYLAADAAEGEQPTAEPTGEPGTSSQAAGEPTKDADDYSFVYEGNTFLANLYTDASGEKIATITRVDEAGAEATVLDFPAEIPDPAGDPADPYTVTKIHLVGGFNSIPYDNVFASVQFPKNVEEISFAYGARRLSQVTELTIPGSVKNFGGSLQGMTALKTLTFEDGVKEISGDSIVSGCSNLTTIQLPRSLKKLSGTATFSDATKLTTITLPEEIENTLPEGIEIKEGSTFSGCTNLQEIELPASITKINDSMFAGCTSLKTVTAKVTTIGESAFNGCTKLETMDLHKVTSLGAYAFYNCKALSGKIDLSGLDTIPGMAFAYDENITAIQFNNTLRSIGMWAFIKAGTTTIELPDTVESIGSYAFYYSKLKGALQLPDSLKTLGGGAFSGCAGIEAVAIGPNLTDIPASAFDGCPLKTVTINNSEDNVTVTGTFPGVTPTYALPPSVTGVGDTIKEGETTTLQAAVNAAAVSGKPVIIEKNIQLNAPVKVPAGKTVVITSDARQIILGDRSHKPDNLFVIAEDASLQFEGSVELHGQYNTGSMISNEGELTLDGPGVLLTGGVVSDNSGVIDNRGAGANFVLKDGTIENNKVNGAYSGTIRVREGASFAMSGGTIQNNQVKAAAQDGSLSSPGVLLYGKSSFELTGGEICNNTGVRGGGVMAQGTDAGKAYFEMTGGSIHDNVCSSDDSDYDAAGAVYLQDNAMFLMGGGEIDANRGGNGGGVCVNDTVANAGDVTAFIFDGGRITNNHAYAGGGGVYSLSNGVKLLSGVISGNSAVNGGGVYSEGSARKFSPPRYTTLYMENAVIRHNTADQGGGAWFCPTGDAQFYLTNGVALYENTATGAGDDFASAPSSHDRENSTTIPSRMLGGGKVQWYKDGAIADFSNGANHTSVVLDVSRYDPANPVQVGSIQKQTGGICLKADADADAISTAAGCAQLIIENNTATYGGGIGANGSIVIGDAGYQTYEVTVQKVWNNKGYEDAQPDSVTVHLKEKYTGHVVDTAELNAGNAWKHTFVDLPDSPEHYTVEEEPVDGYTARYAQDADGSFTITNTYQTKAVSVRKVWVDDDLEFRPASVEVELAAIDRIGAFAPRTAVLSADNNWTYTFDNLPAEHTYLVTEKTQAAGYQTTITGDEGTGFVITNTYQPTPTDTPVTPPTPPDKPVTPPTTPDKPVTPPTTPDKPVTPPTTPDKPVTPPTPPDTPVTPPTTPDKPVTPPTTPDKPVTPPTPPENPDTPVTPPTTPDKPVTPPTPPENPDTPVTPPTPPENPDTPVTPPTPPENPDTPVTPPTPPENPDTPVTPPTTPDNPGTSILPPFLPLLPLIPLIPLIPWIPDEPATSAPPEQPENPPVEVPEETPEQPEETPPTSVPESEPEEPSSSSEVPENEPEEVKTPTRRLIQTGQNEWLVWVLAAAGGSFLLLGIHKRRKGKHEA